MNILTIGEEWCVEECRLKFGDAHVYTHLKKITGPSTLEKQDVIFDFTIHQKPAEIKMYRNKVLFLNTACVSLKQLAAHLPKETENTLIGFAGLPGFIDRPVLEVSIHKKESEPRLIEICQLLNSPFQLVEDSVGLVTPRVICMIINEAYYTVEEGTATRQDIDLAMKLGTNYPYGPFEWCQKIGVRHVYELLEAVYRDTQHERYKICPLLRQEYLSTS